MQTPALEARNLCKVYRRGSGENVHALRDVSLSVQPGAYVVFTGPSGSGKSTLLSLLGALEIPTSGEVRLLGQSLKEVSEAQRSRLRRRIGIVFQNSYLLPRLSLWENVAYPLIPEGVAPRDRYFRAAELLREFGLGDRVRSAPGELSGGEQQRVALARALIANPEIILADEPTASLDPAAEEKVMAHLLSRHSQGTALVLATHAKRLAPTGAEFYEVDGGRVVRASSFV